MTVKRVLIADVHRLMREGLKTILNYRDDLEVVGQASDGLEVIKKAEQLKPDLVLIDMMLPVIDGIECSKRLKKLFSGIKVLMLIPIIDEDNSVSILASGVDGVLLRNMKAEQLFDVISYALEGQVILPSQIVRKLANKLITSQKVIEAADHQKKKVYALSDREREIASLIMKGYSNKQIAKLLFLTEGTTKNYVSSIYRKLDVQNRTGAKAYLRQLEPDDVREGALFRNKK